MPYAIARQVPPSDVSAQPLNVLVVGSNAKDFSVLQTGLGAASMVHLHRARDWTAACVMARKRVFDATFLALDRERADEAMQMLSQHQETPFDWPLILVCAHADPVYLAPFLERGGTDFIDIQNREPRYISARIELAKNRLNLGKTSRDRHDLLSGLITSLGHDLKAPVRQISTLCDQIEDDLVSARNQTVCDRLDAIRSRCQHLNGILADTMTYATGSWRAPVPGFVDLRTVFERVVENVDLNERARVRLSGNCSLSVDASLCVLMVQNLVTNGLKFWRGVPSLVAIEGENVAQNSVIRVRDTGIGIAPDLLETVFKPGLRAVSREEFPGTGYGLPIVRMLAHAHGGRVELTSEPGHGTEVTITLPNTPRPHRKSPTGEL